MKIKLALVLSVATFAAAAQQANRDNFARQQAYAEMQRVTGQIDVLQNNFDDLQRRVGKLEGAGNDRSVKAEIDALKNAVAELRRELAAQRGEIVKDITGKISKMQKELTPPPPPPPQVKKVVVGPHKEYVVKAGDTLSLVAEAFGTTVSKIKEMNGLKRDSLRIGQKLRVPLD